MTEELSGRSVDMIVAVHDTRRNVKRAVGSILADPDPSIRALVVAHNVPLEEVQREIEVLLNEHRDRIRVIECSDGIPSPSGPFNLGLAESTAAYVGIMGSDDELDVDAIRSWRRRLEQTRADMVVAKVVLESECPVRRPLGVSQRSVSVRVVIRVLISLF